MAGRDRMTIEDVVRQVLRDEHGDVIRESVRAVAQKLMEVEVSELIGAQHGERTEDRATHRNGYRPTRWDTRAGEIELQIPKMRQGSYFPSFLQLRKRSEQALVSWCSRPTSAGCQRGASTSSPSRSGCGSRSPRSAGSPACWTSR
jgi:putative transposase